MDSSGFPWLAFWAGCGFVFIYSMGERLETAYGEHLKNIGLIGAAFLLFHWFTSYCPTAATQMALTLLITAILFKLILWVIFKLRDQGTSARPRPDTNKSLTTEGRLTGDDIYEKTIQSRRQEKFGPRRAGFEQIESRREQDSDN